MVALLLATLVAQSPPAAPNPELAVVVTRRSGMSVSQAEAVGDVVVEFLKKEGLTVLMGPKDGAKQLAVLGVKDSADCDGKRPCVAGLGRVLRAAVVVGVEVAELEGSLAVNLEAVETDRADRLAQKDALVAMKTYSADLEPTLSAFAAALREGVVAATTIRPFDAPGTSSDAPKQVNLEPQPSQGVPLPTVAGRGPGAGVWVTGGAAVAAAAVAITFLAIGLSAKGELDGALRPASDPPVYELTQPQAEALAGRANTAFSVSLGTGLGAVALGVTAGVLAAVGGGGK